MATMQEVAERLKAHLSPAFGYIRLSGALTPEQLAKELATIPEGALPALVILADSANYVDLGVTRELTVGVVLIDRFVPNPDNRQVSVWQAVETLQDQFKITGTALGDTVYIPQNFSAFKADLTHVGYVLELKVTHPV